MVIAHHLISSYSTKKNILYQRSGSCISPEKDIHHYVEKVLCLIKE